MGAHVREHIAAAHDGDENVAKALEQGAEALGNEVASERHREGASTMRRTNDREIQAVLRLDGPERFSHFVKRVADEERAWGLWNDGWALMAIADGTYVFPLWPASEYAGLHRTGHWAGYEAREIPLTELLDDLIPKLAERGVLPGVFPTPTGKGVTPTPEELATALRNELENYE